MQSSIALAALRYAQHGVEQRGMRLEEVAGARDNSERRAQLVGHVPRLIEGDERVVI